MAYKVPAKADETLRSLTDCGICLSEMETPKALSCLHSFCLKCLKAIKHPPDIIICPLCHEQTILTLGGIDGLRDNFLINQLKDKKAEVKVCVCCKSVNQDPRACCVDCNGFICQQCVSSHKILAPLASHKVFSADELRSGKIDLSEMIKDESCHKHKDQVVRWFCKTCNMAICRDCTVMEHKQPDHDFVTMENATEEQKKEIKTLMSSCKELSKQLKDVNHEMDQVKINLDKAVNDITKELDQERKAYMEAIQRSYQENICKLAQIQMEQVEKINLTKISLESMQSKLTDAMEIANQVITSGSMHYVASNYSTLCSTLTQLQEYKPFGISKSAGVVVFKPSQKDRDKIVDIGRVLKGERLRDTKGRWICERKIGTRGNTTNVYGITVSRNSLFYEADYGSRSVKIFDEGGHLKHEIKDNIGRPIDIALTTSRFYVADKSPFIKCFKHDGKYIMKFPAMSPKGKASNADGSQLYGIATDHDGDILVGNYTKKYISKHRRDGTHISTFPVGIQPFFLKVTANGRIVVTSCANTPAHIFDPDGALLHIIKKPIDAKIWHPSGLACSDDGSILINSHKDGIYSFTEDGEYIGCVTKDVTRVSGLDMFDDKLVVAQFCGLPAKIYTYQEEPYTIN